MLARVKALAAKLCRTGKPLPDLPLPRHCKTLATADTKSLKRVQSTYLLLCSTTEKKAKIVLQLFVRFRALDHVPPNQDWVQARHFECKLRFLSMVVWQNRVR